MRRFGSLGMSSSGAIGRVGVQGDGSLADVISSAVFDLDATQASSYTSGVTWSNLVTAPADGSAQTAYDFYRGDGATSTTYPTFNGSAGSAAAYWSFDGGDYFRLKSGTNTAFLNNLHKTTGGQDFWFAVSFRTVNYAASTPTWSTKSGVTNSQHGVAFEVQSTEIPRFVQSNGSASAIVTYPAVTVTTDYLIIGSHSHSGNQTRVWINSTSVDEDAQTYGTTTTNSSLIHIGSTAAPGNYLPSGSLMYSFAMGNEYLDNTKAAAIIAALQTRHGRIYAP